MKVANKYFDMLNFKGGIIMLCQNCNKNEATVKYTEIINGEKREVMLCEECSRELGIGHMNFNMPIDFSSFFGDLLEGYEDNSFMPLLTANKQLKCNNCNMSFDEFMEQGKFGCEECYDAFSPKFNWVTPRYLAIDQGTIVPMIENYRTGLLWNLFMQAPEVKVGLQNLGFSSAQHGF